MTPLSEGLQYLWGDIIAVEHPSCEHYRSHCLIAQGAHLVLRGEEQRIAWNIYMMCQSALIECLRQQNERICNELRELA